MRRGFDAVALLFPAITQARPLDPMPCATGAQGVRPGVLLQHDDAAREVAYDRKSPFGRLDRGRDEASPRVWTLVGMKDHRKRVRAPARCTMAVMSIAHSRWAATPASRCDPFNWRRR
jgi:hypothetical protein